MFVLRHVGTGEFVSHFNPADPNSEVEFVEGWGHPDSLVYSSHRAAMADALQIEEMDGVAIRVEVL